jgi:hypothetical protein
MVRSMEATTRADWRFTMVARDFNDASPDDRFKITRGNVARLYGFEL